MNDEEIIEQISETLSLLDFENFKKAVNDALKAGVLPKRIMLEGIARGVEIVGEKYEKGEYFLSELVIAGHMLKEAIEKLKPALANKKLSISGKVVIGTVEGDIHDIGKNLVAYMLSGAGFEVHDLGVDVSPAEFVDAVREVKPGIVGISALLTTTMINIGTVIKELENAGLRNEVKVIVGGRSLTQEYAKEIGADGYAKDATKAVEKVKELMNTS